jgi:DNA-binding MarR family transcriptional regulator
MERKETVTPGGDLADTVDENSAEAFGWAIGSVSRAYRDVAMAALDEFAPGPRGYQVLAAVGHGAPRSQTALANLLGIERTPMTYLIDELENSGFVQRTLDPEDRRARIIHATPLGLDTLATLDERLRRAETTLLGALGDEHARTARTLLIRLAGLVADPDLRAAACASTLDD